MTQTDSEVIAHLVHSNYRGDLLEAVQATVAWTAPSRSPR
jgi:glucosamine 6-phosphate synthetase-like amidotransferase/phosphosugar isomerase protein